jgi:hypothetical protein
MPARARPLAERLDRVDLRRDAVRRDDAERALWRHLCAIGADTDNVEWVADIEEGFEQLHSQLQGRARVWEPSASGSWNRYSLWRPDALYSYPDRELHRREDLIGAPIVRVARGSLGRRWHVHRTSRTHRRWRRRYAHVPDPVSVYRLALAAADEDAVVRAGLPSRESFEQPAGTGSDWDRKQRAHWQWRKAVQTYDAAQCRLPTLRPLVDAWAAGLLFFWIVESRTWSKRSCIAVPRPTLHLEAGRLNRSDGPAVEWKSGTSYWFWEGLHVPKRVAARQSERARLQVLARTRNMELRRLLLNRIGYERFLDIAGSELIAQDDFGKLWRCDLQIDHEPLRVVEVVNSTPDPDGSHRRYTLRVPPNVRTAREAVAWTFGFDNANDYLLAAAS